MEALLFRNPSSGHVYGDKCNKAVRTAREQVANLVGARPDEIYFTSCGTESNNWAIWGVVASARKRGIEWPHVVTTQVEHPAVLRYVEALREQGLLRYTTVAVNEEGIVALEDVVGALTQDTVLVSIMHANNEVGSIQPVQQIATAAKRKGIVVHCDAAQSMGKIDVQVDDLNVDLLSIVGHKFGAPKGVAALYIRSGVQLEPMLRGGGQEAGMRAGTENVLLVVGLGKAAELARLEAVKIPCHMEQMRDKLFAMLQESFGQGAIAVNGPKDSSCCLPNTLNVRISGLDAAQLLSSLRNKVAASAGSACHSGKNSISEVLSAMKVSEDQARGTLRLSTGRHTTKADIEFAVKCIVEAAAKQGLCNKIA
ncbi:unnamed protein product [Ostreobium quekettii]|uniref:Aminotransferase class V domain-containing protein n=1 Tax=Ostreobium quekettii TaxID=121088 RepID=A0A8S1J814_9CHLO|nr:unnamed protein product [Ostreobium quekettii]